MNLRSRIPNRSRRFLSRPPLLCLAVITGLIVAGCAPSPISPGDRSVSATGPAHVLDDSSRVGDTVVWGGEIVAVRNLEDATELAVVSRPLDRGDRPSLRAEGGVRFIAIQSGFLEPVNYAPGRFVTVLGVVRGVENRQVGEYSHAHPVLTVDQLHLWPVNPADWQPRTRFSLGVGVRL